VVAEMGRESPMRRTLRTIATVFSVAVAVNYPWELAQAPLYEGMSDFSFALWHCFVASLGDGLLVLLIFGAGWVMLRRRDWFVNPGWRSYLVMLASGLVIGVFVEWVAVHVAERWAYAPRMPVIPIFNIGLTPLVQMLVLPPLIFRGVAMSYRGGVRDGKGGGDPDEV
jgi:amino acid transporter